MSFWENDFVQMQDFTDSLLESYENQEFIIDVLKEIGSLRKRVPINPGIVAMCARNIIKAVKPEEVDKNDKHLVVTIDGNEYYGETHITPEMVVVENYEIPQKEVSKIVALNMKTLEELWPTLVFDIREK